MDRTDGAAIRLCGRLEVAPQGSDVSQQLPGRQGRLLVAYLACHRARPVTRDQLIDLLWPADPPSLPDEVLGSLLSKARRALGAGVIEGRHDLTLVLPAGARVDVELAADAIEDAEAALAAVDARLAFARAQTACQLTEGGFLPGFVNSWVEKRRREVEELHLRALECVAAAGLALRGAELGSGERAARELISAAPLRELGYRLLMEILAERGDFAAALQAYDSLRVALRDELGIAPGPAVRALHERLLEGGDEVAARTDERAEPPQAPHREERKLVTVVAAELQGTEASDDPEDLRVATARVQARIRHEVRRFGGTVEEAADGIALALFGAVLAHEDDVERAVRAALRLRELGLAARAGVATGEVLVAPQAPAGGTATGRAIEHAIRMQRAASPGAVIADEVTVRSTPPDAVVYDALEENAWVVQGVSERLTAALEHPARTRFLGRESELTLLESVHKRVLADRHPSLVLILGHAGVGKSRLAEEFLNRGELSPPPSVYRGRCLAYGEGTTYWALREVLWAAAGIGFDDPAAIAAATLRARVDSAVAASEAERVTAALAIASGIVLPDNPLARLTPGSVGDEVALAWPAFLSGLAGFAPVVVVIEDLHWAEEPLLEMLERIVARSTGPLLVVVTARPELAERLPGWSTRPEVTQIPLDRLREDVTRELVSELLPQTDADLRERVVATAEGNPFFAEELARHLSDAPRDLAEIPNTVRAVLAARVDGLPEREKQVVQDAAVVGRVFWAPTLEAIEPREALPDALRILEDRGLVVTRPTSSLAGQTELSFRHGLTREVAYRSIPRARRCRIHAAVGEWLEQLAGDRRDEFIDLLAHHYEAASAPGDTALAWPEGSPEPEQLRKKAVAALIEAGEAARIRLSPDQALRFAERAQNLAATDEERLAMLELEARAHHAAVRSDKALAAYTAGIDLARRIGDHEMLSRLRAYAILLCVRYAGAFSGESWRAEALTLVEEAAAEGSGGAPTFARGALLLGKSWGVHRWLRRPREDLATAKREAEQAIAIAETIHSSELLAAAVEGFTWLISEEGFCGAEEMAEALLRASADPADRVEAHESKVTAACCLAWAGRFDRAVAVAAKTTSEAATLSRHRALHSAMAETFCLVPTGRFSELGDATTRVLELAAEDASSTRTCMAAVVGIAGRALWLHEELETEAAADAVDLMNRVSPPKRGSIYEYFVAELVRPIIGTTSTLLDSGPPPPQDAASMILYLRALLPVLALSGGTDELQTVIADAQQLARSACAPALGWIADWAAAVQTSADDPTGSLPRALAATTALQQYGEPYTAARLFSDFLPLVEGPVRGELADETAEQLTLMGALASAASARCLR